MVARTDTPLITKSQQMAKTSHNQTRNLSQQWPQINLKNLSSNKRSVCTTEPAKYGQTNYSSYGRHP